MTNSEYQELVEFLGRKFDEVDHWFEGMDRRLDQMATKEEMRAQQGETRPSSRWWGRVSRGRFNFSRRGTKRLWRGRSGY